MPMIQYLPLFIAIVTIVVAFFLLLVLPAWREHSREMAEAEKRRLDQELERQLAWHDDYGYDKAKRKGKTHR